MELKTYTAVPLMSRSELWPMVAVNAWSLIPSKPLECIDFLGSWYGGGREERRRKRNGVNTG